MIEQAVDLGKLVAGAAWAVVALLIAAAWVVGLLVNWQIGMLLATSACALSAAAAVLHIRCFMVRVLALIRATSQSSDESVLRRVP